MKYKKQIRRAVKDSTVGIDILDTVVEKILDRKDEYVDEDGGIDANLLDDIIAEEMDAQIIYDEDMWDIMKSYQSPQDADWAGAFDIALDDVTDAVRDELGI